jgi:hypothetical protein
MVTFDGPQRLIIVDNGVTQLSAKEVYSAWKEWVTLSDNAKFAQAFSVLGGDPLPGARSLGSTYFLENGWKIRPFEGNHTLTLEGNLYARDGTDPFVSTIGVYQVRINLSTSNLVDTVATGGGGGLTVSQVRDAVWAAPTSGQNVPGSFGMLVKALLTLKQFLGLK